MTDDESRPLIFFDNVGHCESFSASGNAVECLVLFAGFQAVGKQFDGLGLVALRLKIGFYLKVRHKFVHIQSGLRNVKNQNDV